ncbi:MAG: FprA family A-type flavoprotein [Candidatus Eisenbacteria bacterium]|nr:FprA family A-type flavoprotein [Candidatus Eisenbacteria bacterium]
MPRPLEAKKISDHAYWVGAIDWDIRDFHGYTTRRGTTYNAYLVMADRITLIDTVKAPYRDELMTRISSVIEPRDISVIVSNHSEMDHSGCLGDVIEAVQPELVVASPMGTKALQDHFHRRFQVSDVADGESLSLGNLTLRFYETRMLHWPDSMFTYLDNDRLLFSQDAFGMHLASTERFDDELDDCVLFDEAGTYYANILLPYSPLIAKLLDRIGSLGLELKLVAPDHGPVWKSKFARIAQSYATWAAQKPTLKAVVAYDTMWGSTAKMARAVADGLAAGGASPRLVNLRSSPRSDLATELLEAGALLVGTPTLNNGMFPTLGDALTYVKGLRPRNLVGAVFGSYGWSGEGVTHAGAILEEMKVELLSDALSVKYVPDAAALQDCRALGVKVAEHLVRLIGL